MTPIYLKILCWLLVLLFGLWLGAIWRINLRLRLAYPFQQPPKLPFSQNDWPFLLKLAKFSQKQLQLKQLHCQMQLIGRPDICAITGGALMAALHSLAAAANCRDANLQLHLTANATNRLNCPMAEVMLKISLPLWVIITILLRTAVYYIRRQRKLKVK